MFYARIYLEMGDYEKAIKFMEEKKGDILDKILYYEMLHELHIKLDQREQAISCLE